STACGATSATPWAPSWAASWPTCGACAPRCGWRQPSASCRRSSWPCGCTRPTHDRRTSRRPGMGDRAAKESLYAEFAAVGKVLGHPRRLELLDLLAQGPRSVEDLAAAAAVGMSTCSAHLQ